MSEIKRLYKDWAKDYDTDSICNTAIILGEKMILPMLKPKKTDRILDIGCGTGRVTKILAPKAKEIVKIKKISNSIRLMFQKNSHSKIIPSIK